MSCFLVSDVIAQDHHHHHHHESLHHWEIPSKDPDRIILTFHEDPATSRAVTWRTDHTVKSAMAQIAEATVNSKFVKNAITVDAVTEPFDLGLYKSNASLIVHYHSVLFEGLKPDMLYAYRVGDGDYWSGGYSFVLQNQNMPQLNLCISVMHKTMCSLIGLVSSEWLIRPHQMPHL